MLQVVVESGSDDCCLGPFIIILIGAAMAYGGVQKYRLSQKIRNTPTSKVRSAAMGLVELFGKAKLKQEFKSPITLKPCVYWRIKAEYYHSSGKNSEWRTFYDKHTDGLFLLSDDTGDMLIDPLEAEVDIKHDFFYDGHLSGTTFFGLLKQKQLDKALLSWLGRDADAEARFKGHGDRQLRVYEYIIEPDDGVYVLGSAVRRGNVSSDVAHENLIIKKDKHDNLMYISDKSEKQVLSGMGIGPWILMSVGVGIICLGIIFLIAWITDIMG
jgi:hypothetical protein